MLRFDGKVAIVTGASSGIGQAVAQALLNEGAKVFAVGSHHVPDFDHHKADFETWRCDLTDPGQAALLAKATMNRFGRIDLLVNAAGILQFGDCQTTTDSGWAEVLALNLTVPFELIRACVPELSTSHGAVVNISSINSYRPFANTLAYSVSKAGLDQLTRCAAVELAPHRIRVNAVNPGVVVTDLHLRAGMDREAYAEFIKRSFSTHPLGRPGVPEDVATAVLFLAEASWVTGVCMAVDGGRNLTIVR